MAKPNLTFLRRFQFFAALSLEKKLEPVTITLGFTGAVSADSGMVLNLKEIDAWIKKFKHGFADNIFLNRWDFCKASQAFLKKLINRKELTQIHFSFHDLFVNCIERKIYMGWRRTGEVRLKDRIWVSPVTLTYKVAAKGWPKLTKAQEARVLKKMELVNLTTSLKDAQKVIKKNTKQSDKKNDKWNDKFKITDYKFSSFEYFDPILDLKIILKK